DGLRVYQGLSIGKGNLLYGATTGGGTNNTGTMFKVLTDGSGYQTLCHFQTNESIAADLLLNSQEQLFGSLLYTQGPDSGALFKFILPGVRALGPSNDGFRLEITGAPGSNYTIESSEDLINWQPSLTLSLLTSPQEFLDPNPHPANRFYRVR
ncbi:MAG TPA: hypothetical protein VMZ27_07430, partial [Candidatus Saccharimonadales bacterium]|nr:hypothetical protein [Candidatus Saccharimonadales bacterium]